MIDINWRGRLQWLSMHRYPLWVAFCLGFFLMTYLSRPIFDPDFFWHLKTGEWIWQHHALPVPDPFTLTPHALLDVKQKFILTSYWLAQVIYYGLYDALGWWGIVLLRIVLAGLLAYVIHKRCSSDRWIDTSLLIIAMLVLMSVYPLERPQVFSFLGFAVLLYVLDRLPRVETVRERWRITVFFAAVMLIWGNMHGGVLLGQLTIVMYLVWLCFQYFALNQRIDSESFRFQSIISIVALLLSLCNPNGNEFLTMLANITQPDKYLVFISEYQPFFKNILEKTNKIPVVLFFILFFVFVVRNKKYNLFLLLICLLTGALGLYQTRYMPFFIISVLPYAGSGAIAIGARRYILASLLVIIAVLFVAFGRYELNNLRLILRYGPVFDTKYTPVSAANYILANDLQGNILNAYDWGGYLIYALAPDRKIFVDGRTLYERSFREWCAVSGMAVVQNYPREKIFDDLVKKYDFKYVLVPQFYKNDYYLLAKDLYKRSDWEVLFRNRNSIIFKKIK